MGDTDVGKLLDQIANSPEMNAFTDIYEKPIGNGNFDNVYQFKIILKGIQPNIWRRILVPENFNFRELHLAVNHSMGWLNTHMHEFRIKNPNTGVDEVICKQENDSDPYGLLDTTPTISEVDAKISNYFTSPKYKAIYAYDFGDGWEHKVIFEKVLPKVPDTEYPECIDGKRACPPENCGGPYGYKEMLEILADPNNPEYENRRSDLAINGAVDPDEFDPDEFDKEEVHFYDSDQQKEMCYQAQNGCSIM